jgi:hypothetical protein
MGALNTRRDWLLMVAAGLLPILAVHLAFALNIRDGMGACIPYWDGCLSVSRAVRSGPGLWWFRMLAAPAMVLMWLSWSAVREVAGKGGNTSARLRWLVALGWTGAVFFLVYALWLGTEGEVYRWLRRYGVVFYFGCTGLAHLMLLGAWPSMAKRARGFRVYRVVVLLAWAAGIASAFKRQLSDDPAFVDRLENALEWQFALYLSLAFVAMGLAWRNVPRNGWKPD